MGHRILLNHYIAWLLSQHENTAFIQVRDTLNTHDTLTADLVVNPGGRNGHPWSEQPRTRWKR